MSPRRLTTPRHGLLRRDGHAPATFVPVQLTGVPCDVALVETLAHAVRTSAEAIALFDSVLRAAATSADRRTLLVTFARHTAAWSEPLEGRFVRFQRECLVAMAANARLARPPARRFYLRLAERVAWSQDGSDEAITVLDAAVRAGRLRRAGVMPVLLRDILGAIHRQWADERVDVGLFGADAPADATRGPTLDGRDALAELLLRDPDLTGVEYAQLVTTSTPRGAGARDELLVALATHRHANGAVLHQLLRHGDGSELLHAVAESPALGDAATFQALLPDLLRALVRVGHAAAFIPLARRASGPALLQVLLAADHLGSRALGCAALGLADRARAAQREEVASPWDGWLAGLTPSQVARLLAIEHAGIREPLTLALGAWRQDPTAGPCGASLGRDRSPRG